MTNECVSENLLDETYNWSGKTVLIVEDDDISYYFLEAIVEPTGAEVLIAENGASAIGICNARTDISLILMDIQLDQMDGLTATQKIKSFRPELPIIAQTAKALEGDEEICLAAGCDDYVQKPIDSKLLLRKMNNFLK